MLTSSVNECESFSLGLLDIKSDFAFSESKFLASQPSEIEKAAWGVELLQELGPLRHTLSFVSVIRFLLYLNCQSEILLSECLLVLVGSFLGFSWVGAD